MLESIERRFSSDRLSRIRSMERWHFWFVGRRALINRLLSKYAQVETDRLLDLGCGSGLMVETLMHQGHRVIGLDLRPEGLIATRQGASLASLVQSEVTRLPLVGNCFGAVIMLDLLEHVDDLTALEQVHRILRPGGWALITVPAMPSLWSYRDVAAGHLRRYTWQQLHGAVTKARLVIEEMHYYQFLLLPFIVFTRWLGRKTPMPSEWEEKPMPILNRLFTWITNIEIRLGDQVRWPCGSSLVVVCRKADE